MESNIFCVMGNVDAGKSTLIGVLKNEQLDNGKGSARESILQLKHEKQSGNTTNGNFVKLGNKNGDIVHLLDVAGHDKYFHNSMRAISEYNPGYAIIVISAIKGINDNSSNLVMYGQHKVKKGKIIQNMTTVYMNICTILRLPIIIVLNKVDIATEDQIRDTMKEVKVYTKKLGYKMDIEFSSDTSPEGYSGKLEKYEENPEKILPIFKASNVSGQSIDVLKKFLFDLDKRNNIKKDKENLDKFATENGINHVFDVIKPYYKKGTGIIVYGYNKLGEIRKGDILNIGPISKNYIQVRIRDLHDDNREGIEILKEGCYGCLAIKPVNVKDKISKKMVKRGKIVTDSNIMVAGIKCAIKISHNKSTIEPRYKAFLHCGNVGDPVFVKDADHFPVRGGDLLQMTFKFTNCQFVYPGSKFIIREEGIKGYGVIQEIIKLGDIEFF